MPTKKVQIPYAPRKAFERFHQRTERWACLVAHRRAGKTVAAVNDTLRRATMNKREGDYAYIAPFRSQAKAVAWDYIKHYAHGIIESTNEAELMVRLVNGSRFRLFGADNADAMRGLGFDGVYLDEYGDFRPSVWGNVIRPTLSDRRGWAVFAGTPKGHNQFYDIFQMSQRSPDWFSLVLKASDSGILDKEELRAASEQLSEDQYNQEYECSFDAAILGAFYGTEMLAVDAENRVTQVAYDEAVEVETAWDLGYRDDTAIWWWQRVGNEIHLIDHYAASGASVRDLAAEIQERPYRYRRHWLPHDARAKTLASGGKSIVEQLGAFLGYSNLAIVPDIGVQDGIQAVRRVLPQCWFDRDKCADGIEALRQYQREYDEDKKVFRKQPLHNWTSHTADAFRMMAVAEKKKEEVEQPKKRGTTLQTMTLDELWEEHEQRQMEVRRI